MQALQHALGLVNNSYNNNTWDPLGGDYEHWYRLGYKPLHYGNVQQSHVDYEVGDRKLLRNVGAYLQN